MSGALLLAQFLLRMTFGLSLGMALTSPRQVTSGYFRNHLYVLLGFCVLASLALGSIGNRWLLVPPVAAAVLSYVGAVCWLYEKPKAGIVALILVSALALAGIWQPLAMSYTSRPDFKVSAATAGNGPLDVLVNFLDGPTSGLVLGMTLAAMFLGHWYLNTPTMALAPLERLIRFMQIAIVVRAGVSAVPLLNQFHSTAGLDVNTLAFLLLRWLAGIFGALLLTVMAAKTLKIPNTQSATGILYVAVIVTFIGELASLLMGVELGQTV